MSYLDMRSRPSAASMAGVVVIHGALGLALYFGLTVTGVVEKREVFSGFQIDPPKPPPPEPTASPTEAATRDPFVPPIPIPLPPRGPELDQTDAIPSPLPPLPQPGPTGEVLPPRPTPTPSFAPLPAKPRTDPAGWVTTDDYRSNWIRQEMTGKARFRLEIAADGRVTSCAIIGSSGHPQLDAATCALVSRRAKFQPARGDGGEPVAGSYSNAIDWRLPE